LCFAFAEKKSLCAVKKRANRRRYHVDLDKKIEKYYKTHRKDNINIISRINKVFSIIKSFVYLKKLAPTYGRQIGGRLRPPNTQMFFCQKPLAYKQNRLATLWSFNRINKSTLLSNDKTN
jgi:hypothetical protein